MKDPRRNIPGIMDPMPLRKKVKKKKVKLKYRHDPIKMFLEYM